MMRSPLIRIGTAGGQLTQKQIEDFRKETYKDVIDLFGREKVKQAVNEKSMEAGQNSAYEKTVGNIANCWITLGLMALLLALLSIIALEFIDKDKR